MSEDGAILLIFVVIGAYLWLRKANRENRIAALRRQLEQADAASSESLNNFESKNRKWSPAFGNFCTIDVETTGLKSATSHIIQLSLVLFHKGIPNGKRVWWIDPEVKIPKNATKVNNITNDDVVGKGNFRFHSDQMKRMIERYPLVGHNLYFDCSMIRAEFQRANIEIKIQPLYCTMRRVWGQESIAPPETGQFRRRRSAGWQKLSDTASDLGVAPSGQLHDAFVDAKLAGECFVALARMEIERSSQEVVARRKEAARLRAELKAALEKS